MPGMLDWLSEQFHRLLVGISRALSPAIGWIDAIGFEAEREMDWTGIPVPWQPWIVAALWVVVLVAFLWLLRGVWRLAAILVVGLVLLRYFQVLPAV